MPKTDLTRVLRYLGKLDKAPDAVDLTDTELLDRFRDRGQETAFIILLQRHGPMVLGVCRRILGSCEDAEDAFQATFLLLATKADSVREKASLGSWLHGVAQRIALNARKGELRRRTRERQWYEMKKGEPLDMASWEELRLVLDEELNSLPEKYRAPLVLCYLEGKTNEQAAQELGCPKSSIGWRLGRARELLRQRLAKRGISISAGALAAILTGQDATAALPAILVISTARAAVKFVTGGAAAVGMVSERAISLTKGPSVIMALNKYKIVVSLLFIAGLGGFAVLAGTSEASKNTTGEVKENPVQRISTLSKIEEPVFAASLDTDGKQEVADQKSVQKQTDKAYHFELMRWVALNVDPAKGMISARAIRKGSTNEAWEGLTPPDDPPSNPPDEARGAFTLNEVPVAVDARILVNGLPGQLKDLRPGMILSLRLKQGGSEISMIVAVKPKDALTSYVLEDVDLSKRLVSIKLSDTNTIVALPVAKDVDVVIDGKPAQLGELRKLSCVSVKLAPMDGQLVVKAIRAYVFVLQKN
jgi:RNA polymerase sigma factor (sigma-70 family)